MVVTVAVEGLNGFCRVLFLVVVDEGESLALVGHLVLGQVDSGNGSEVAEEVLEVTFHNILAKVGYWNGGGVLV